MMEVATGLRLPLEIIRESCSVTDLTSLVSREDPRELGLNLSALELILSIP